MDQDPEWIRKMQAVLHAQGVLSEKQGKKAEAETRRAKQHGGKR